METHERVPWLRAPGASAPTAASPEPAARDGADGDFGGGGGVRPDAARPRRPRDPARIGFGVGVALLLVLGSALAALAQEECATREACASASHEWSAAAADLAQTLAAADSARERAVAITGYADSGRGAGLIDAVDESTSGATGFLVERPCLSRGDARAIRVDAARAVGASRLINVAVGRLDSDARAIVSSADAATYFKALAAARESLADAEAHVAVLAAKGAPPETLAPLKKELCAAWAVVDAEDSDGDEPPNHHSFGTMIDRLDGARLRLERAVEETEAAAAAEVGLDGGAESGAAQEPTDAPEVSSRAEARLLR